MARGIKKKRRNAAAPRPVGKAHRRPNPIRRAVQRARRKLRP